MGNFDLFIAGIHKTHTNSQITCYLALCKLKVSWVMTSNRCDISTQKYGKYVKMYHGESLMRNVNKYFLWTSTSF